ncbi:MAG: hypothetical protein NW203_05880 [Hyphomonadaceae bacterium]|nr:hypothetical protein [Hyphomonadaceae bacterium]
MWAPLLAFSLFNLAAAAACVAAAFRLLQPEERAAWRSRRLLAIAAVLTWSFPPAALAATAWAWSAGGAHATLIALAPLGWLIAMGVIFAIVDVAEDGVLDFGRRKP